MKKHLYGFVLRALSLLTVTLYSCSQGSDVSSKKSDLTGTTLVNEYYNIDDEGYPEEWKTTLTFESSSAGKYYCHGYSYVYEDDWEKDYFTQNYRFSYTFDGKVLKVNVLGDGAWASMTLYYMKSYFSESSDGSGALWSIK